MKRSFHITLIAALVFGLILVAISARTAIGAIEEVKITAGDASVNDNFGRSVAISGETALVGAHLHDDGVSDSGSAYVFVRSGDMWVQQAELRAVDAAADDHFGISVAVSGDTAVIGAHKSDDGGFDSGSAYVFVRSGDTWVQQAKLTATDAAVADHFGWSVTISGDTAIVGAPDNDDGGLNSGSAYIFMRSGDTWVQQAKLTATDAAAYDYFGWSVAFSGNTMLVGACQDDSGSGSAYVFVRSGDTWVQQAKLTATDAAAYDYFGYSVALIDDIAVVGAYWDDDDGFNSGSAYVFVRSGDTWNQQAKLTATDAAAYDYFGRSVAISGDTMLVGAYGDDSGSGSAYIFVRSGETWVQQAKLTATDAADYDYFGYSVDISVDTVLVGAGWDDDGGSCSGSAYVYMLPMNRPPVANAGGPYTAYEGGSVVVVGSGSDPDGDPVTFAWDLDNNGTFETPGYSANFSAAYLDGPSSSTIILQVTDCGGLLSTDQAIVNILNASPSAGDITAPLDPLLIGTTANVSAHFTDPGVFDSHVAFWEWGDNSTSDGIIDEANGSGIVYGSHTYTEAGIYNINLTVTDDDGGAGQSTFQYIVIYDPSAGFVTGSGWIESLAGAYKTDPTATGKATFGFVSKYNLGSNRPTGNTEFQFKAGDLNFRSTSYEWLLVTGANYARFKGSGKINGAGDYKFMLWASDDDPDTFRIRIWTEDELGIETDIYDNGFDQAIDGGSIIIHTQ